MKEYSKDFKNITNSYNANVLATVFRLESKLHHSIYDVQFKYNVKTKCFTVYVFYKETKIAISNIEELSNMIFNTAKQIFITDNEYQTYLKHNIFKFTENVELFND